MKTLKKFEFKTAQDRAIYEWDKLLDGKIYVLTKGEDFQSAVGTMVTMSRTRAQERGLKLNINVDGDTVTLQATGHDDKDCQKRAEAFKQGRKEKHAEYREKRKAAKASAKGQAEEVSEES